MYTHNLLKNALQVGLNSVARGSVERAVIQDALDYLDDVIFIVWSYEDVQLVREDLTKEQARDVLLAVEDTADSENGVSWEDIRHIAELMYPTPDHDELKERVSD
jgi:hypothetical protein